MAQLTPAAGPLCDRIRARSRSEDCASGFVRDAATPPLLLLRAATLYDGLRLKIFDVPQRWSREVPTLCVPSTRAQTQLPRDAGRTCSARRPNSPSTLVWRSDLRSAIHPSKREIVSLVAHPTLLTNTSTVPRRRNWDNSSGTTLMKCSARATKQQRKVRNAVQQDLLVCPNQPELVRDVILDGQVVCPDLDTSLH